KRKVGKRFDRGRRRIGDFLLDRPRRARGQRRRRGRERSREQSCGKGAWLHRMASALRLRAFAKDEERSPDFEPVAAAQGLTPGHRPAVDHHLAAARRRHDEVASFAADDRMMRQHALVAEQSDIALLGAADDRDRLGQRILAPLARVAALAADHQQPSALEQFADQADEEADERAEHDYRDRASERLREARGERLVEQPAERAADEPAERAVALARRRSGGPPDTQSHDHAEQRPSDDAPDQSVENVEKYFAADQAGGAAERAEDRAALRAAQHLAPLADAERLDRGEKGGDEEPDDYALDRVAQEVVADAGECLLHSPGGKAAQAPRRRIEQKLFARNVDGHTACLSRALRAGRGG